MPSVPHQCFGIIPLRQSSHAWEALLIYRNKGFWEFPKGHADKGEDPLTTAKRELFEETGLSVERLLEENPYSFSYYISYQGKQVLKTVFYYVAEVSGDVVLQQEEVQESAWIPWEDVCERLSYDNLKDVVRTIDGEKLK